MASTVPHTPRGDPAVGMLQEMPCYLCPVAPARYFCQPASQLLLNCAMCTGRLLVLHVIQMSV